MVKWIISLDPMDLIGNVFDLMCVDDGWICWRRTDEVTGSDCGGGRVCRVDGECARCLILGAR